MIHNSVLDSTGILSDAQALQSSAHPVHDAKLDFASRPETIGLAQDSGVLVP